MKSIFITGILSALYLNIGKSDDTLAQRVMALKGQSDKWVVQARPQIEEMAGVVMTQIEQVKAGAVVQTAAAQHTNAAQPAVQVAQAGNGVLMKNPPAWTQSSNMKYCYLNAQDTPECYSSPR